MNKLQNIFAGISLVSSVVIIGYGTYTLTLPSPRESREAASRAPVLAEIKFYVGEQVKFSDVFDINTTKIATSLSSGLICYNKRGEYPLRDYTLKEGTICLPAANTVITTVSPK